MKDDRPCRCERDRAGTVTYRCDACAGQRQADGAAALEAAVSDKPFAKLNPIDRKLREVHPIKGFTDSHTVVTVELRQGFELFNTRPYHNYETWSDGWFITDENGVQGRAEDLDDAVEDYLNALQRKAVP